VAVKVRRITGTGTLGLHLTDDDTITDADNAPLGGEGQGNCDFTGGETCTVYVPGDIDGNGAAELADAILGLSILTGGNNPRAEISLYADVSDSGKIGILEVVHILREISE